MCMLLTSERVESLHLFVSCMDGLINKMVDCQISATHVAPINIRTNNHAGRTSARVSLLDRRIKQGSL